MCACVRPLCWQGIQPLLDAVIAYLPSPVEARPAVGTLVKSGDSVSISPDSFKSLCALAFKARRPVCVCVYVMLH